jgi:PIN domain nuclease of toxin-antitoxin system
VANIWEIAIKHRLGKLPIPRSRCRVSGLLATPAVCRVSNERCCGLRLA